MESSSNKNHNIQLFDFKYEQLKNKINLLSHQQQHYTRTADVIQARNAIIKQELQSIKDDISEIIKDINLIKEKTTSKDTKL